MFSAIPLRIDFSIAHFKALILPDDSSLILRLIYAKIISLLRHLQMSSLLLFESLFLLRGVSVSNFKQAPSYCRFRCIDPVVQLRQLIKRTVFEI